MAPRPEDPPAEGATAPEDLDAFRRMARRRGLGDLVFWCTVMAGCAALGWGVAIGNILAEKVAHLLVEVDVDEFGAPLMVLVLLVHGLLAFALITLGMTVRGRLYSTDFDPGEGLTDSWMRELFRALKGTRGLLAFAGFALLFALLTAAGLILPYLEPFLR